MFFFSVCPERQKRRHNKQKYQEVWDPESVHFCTTIEDIDLITLRPPVTTGFLKAS